MKNVLVVMLGGALAAAGALPAAAQEPGDSALAQGQRTFEAVCSACHSLAPPPKQAPPMLMIARHYRAATRTRAEAAERVAAWVPNPSRETALLGEHAFERWGLMPPLPLPAADLRAVGAYVASLAFDSAGGGRGMGPGGGMGPGHRARHRGGH